MTASGQLPVFYIGTIPPGATSLTLDGDEGLHAAKVRRIRVGEQIRIADGAGAFADCAVESVAARTLVARVVRHGADPVRRPTITVVQALPKADRGSLAVELLTEAGVDEIVPWQSRNCVARWSDPQKAARGVAKWAVTAREAAKQSRRTRVPIIAPLISTRELLQRAKDQRTIVLHESATASLMQQSFSGVSDLMVIVGPEGGVSPDEVADLRGVGACVVHLGPEVLRTSSAGLAAVAVISALTGRWDAISRS
ncbi:16S rRNA (uracil1498-N3)-methyltransferase [Antricoccus suffuscus]|uniref:Ribosomal RNA small subunit methyltransferase E n=1 Tax=Antricoccus suffuscus TaxID=1629062 RepID=A0A2T0Z4W7_9ACTN|nr:16S rRNA (uracil(1498)-N(3))-methyltransferase [Antricoccus suffuscus]PRZ31389.1 16S rRNA (uracil1498-N3)-methyltransferase [Antricoccus suffuscus]